MIDLIIKHPLNIDMQFSYYDSIAEDYDRKRKNPWHALVDFLEDIRFKNLVVSGYCLALGCGNGRNFSLYSQYSNYIIGLDNSIELLKLAQKNIKENPDNFKDKSLNIELILSSLQLLPFRPRVIRSVFIIAAIHHIRGLNYRISIMKQIYDILESKGYLILSVWRKFQKKFKFQFLRDYISRFLSPKYLKKQKEKGLSEFGDKYIPWTLSDQGKTYKRFYHFFSHKEVKKLVNHFRLLELKKLGGPHKKDNFFILAKKF